MDENRSLCLVDLLKHGTGNLSIDAPEIDAAVSQERELPTRDQTVADVEVGREIDEHRWPSWASRGTDSLRQLHTGGLIRIVA
jgi:hypothetical protein